MIAGSVLWHVCTPLHPLFSILLGCEYPFFQQPHPMYEQTSYIARLLPHIWHKSYVQLILLVVIISVAHASRYFQCIHRMDATNATLHEINPVSLLCSMSAVSAAVMKWLPWKWILFFPTQPNDVLDFYFTGNNEISIMTLYSVPTFKYPGLPSTILEQPQIGRMLDR